MKCVECKFCLGYAADAHAYMCEGTGYSEWIDEASAEDDNLGCDLYEPNLRDGNAKNGDQ